MIRGFILFISLFIHFQDETIIKNVARRYDNGQPKVVVYYTSETKEKVKEEVFFPNGNMDYVGNYKNHVEHGEWKYFWRNGNIKSFEYYVNGLEDGEMYDYNEQGELIATYVYASGKLIETRK